MKPAKSRPLVIIVFDADDTLWPLDWLYSKAFTIFSLYLHTVFGQYMINRIVLNNRCLQVDKEIIKKWGVRRGRIAELMLRLYREIYSWTHREFSLYFSKSKRRSHKAKIKKIGDLPFDHSQMRWFKGARQILKELKRAGYTICLLTNYDPAEWPKRKRVLGLKEFFPDRHSLAVPEKKTSADFKKLLTRVLGKRKLPRGTRIFAVGNNKVDFLPAIRLWQNAMGIHIPRGSTSPYATEGKEISFTPKPFDHPRVIPLRSITKIPNLIRSLLSAS